LPSTSGDGAPTPQFFGMLHTLIPYGVEPPCWMKGNFHGRLPIEFRRDGGIDQALSKAYTLPSSLLVSLKDDC